MINEELYEKVEQDNGDILLKRKKVEKEFERPKQGYSVFSGGQVCHGDWVEKCFKHFNFFPTKEAAEAHRENQRVFNAIGLACALVNPDGDCGDYSVYQNTFGEWRSDGPTEKAEPYLPRVSTREAAEKVCEVLTEWGL